MAAISAQCRTFRSASNYNVPYFEIAIHCVSTLNESRFVHSNLGHFTQSKEVNSAFVRASPEIDHPMALIISLYFIASACSTEFVLNEPLRYKTRRLMSERSSRNLFIVRPNVMLMLREWNRDELRYESTPHSFLELLRWISDSANRRTH